MSNATATVYHDTRKQSKTGQYPVVIKVYYNKSSRFLPVAYNNQRLRLTPEEFQRSYESLKPKNEYRNYKTAIDAWLTKANNIIGYLEPFNFSTFEVDYLGVSKKHVTLANLFETIIFENEEQGRIKNAVAFQSAIRAFMNFLSHNAKTANTNIGFKEITHKLLLDFERYLTEVEIIKDGKRLKKKASPSTVGCYARAIRAVYNRAIDEGYVNKNLYPFGKGKNKYQIPAGKKIKKGLTKTQVKQLIDLDLTDNPRAQKARDFWLLSYVCNGMQFKDIANLKYENIHGKYFHFIRQKTKNTTKANLTPIVVPITEHVQYMINTYGNKMKSGQDYIFPVLTQGMTAREQTSAVGNFTKFVSQHLKKVSEDLGLDISLANMVARHTFASIVVRSGKSLEFAQQALGHQNKNTTQTYFAGFEDEELMQVNSDLLKF